MRLRILVLLLILSGSARAQTLLDRSPNLSGDWVGAPGTLYFHFIHRFSSSGGPERKVSNIPTFLLAAGLPKRLLIGVNYSTNSTLTRDFPNEWEAFARWAPVAQDLGAPLDLGAQVGYNNSAEGIDGEISAARRIGALRLIVAGRALSDPFDSGRQWAGAIGGTLRLGQYVALAGDAASLSNRDSSERIAWSAGVNIAIPLTPHTLSLHATNAPVGTLQGESRGSSKVRYGFEFTIPLTLRRYIGRRADTSGDTASSIPVPDAPVPVAPVSGDRNPVLPSVIAVDSVKSGAAQASPRDSGSTGNRLPTTGATGSGTPGTRKAKPSALAAKRVIIKNISYTQPRIQIAAGTTVEWLNSDPLPHSVTAVDKSFNSGLIQPGKSYRHTFTKAGTYNFYCMPHPFMKGVVVVKEP